MLRNKTGVHLIVQLLVLQGTVLLSQEVQERPMGPPPGSYRMLSENGTATIPFQLDRNQITIKGKVNDKDLLLVLDTGLGAEGVVIHGSPRIDELGLQYAGQAMVGGAGEGEMIPAEIAMNITIGLPGVVLTKQTFIVMPYDSVRHLIFESHDGGIGGSLFNHFVVEIDFEKNVIRLTEPDRFQYTGDGQIIHIKRMPDGAPVINCTVKTVEGGIYQLETVVDLGAGHALSLNTLAHDHVKVPDKAIEYTLGMGIQGELTGYIGRVSSLQIGSLTLSNIVTSFSDSESLTAIERQGNIGLELLHRFHVIFDYANRRMILNPNAFFNESFEFNMSGAGLKKMSDGTFQVSRVVPDSPASEAGLEIGDIVMQINQQSADMYSMDDIRKLFINQGGTVHLVVRRDKKQIPFRFVLRRLI